MTSLQAKSRVRLKLRKFPYPYKAALTILSDRHGIQTADEFRLFHRFLNTTQETPKGKGLGLEIGDTFWFYDELGNFSYFDKYTNTPSAQAPLIRDYYASGYIDCLHTWGDFSNVPFERKFAEWAVEESARQGMSLPIWVNHGNVHNTHNVNRGVHHHQGARPSSDSFHVDLLFEAGFRVLWRFLTPIIGQDRALSYKEHLSVGRQEASSDAVFVTKRLIKRSAMAVDRVFGGAFGVYDEYADNRFLRPALLDNDRRVHEFFRFNNYPVNIWHGMHVPDLLRQLRAEVIDQLIQSQGYLVVYNHLEYGDMYHPDIVAALRAVGRREEVGDLWITTTAKLLKYNQTYHGLRWRESVDAENNLSVIIEPVRLDPVFGETPVGVAELEGITFAVPNPVRSISFRLGEKELAHAVHFTDGAESIVGFPIRRLEFPE